MASYNINTITQQSLFLDSKKRVQSLFKDEMYFNHFRLGSPPKSNEVLFYTNLYRITQSCECEIVNYIQDKLEGHLEECHKIKKKKSPLHDIIEIFNRKECKGDTNDNVESIMHWTEVEW